MSDQTITQATDLQTFAIDPSHSRVGFSVRHMGFSKVRGRFETFEGAVRLQPGDLSTLEAEGTIETTSITTGDKKRDEHLRSADFFEVETHPHIAFESMGVEEASGGTFTLTGDLTIRDVTEPVELEVEYLGEATDPWGGTRIAFEAQTTINRKDYGLNWNQVLEAGGLLVGEEVEITLEAQAVRQDEA